MLNAALLLQLWWTSWSSVFLCLRKHWHLLQLLLQQSLDNLFVHSAPELSPARPASCPTHWLCPSPACYCANVGKQWYVIQVVHRLDGLKSNSDIYQPLWGPKSRVISDIRGEQELQSDFKWFEGESTTTEYGAHTITLVLGKCLGVKNYCVTTKRDQAELHLA